MPENRLLTKEDMEKIAREIYVWLQAEITGDSRENAQAHWDVLTYPEHYPFGGEIISDEYMEKALSYAYLLIPFIDVIKSVSLERKAIAKWLEKEKFINFIPDCGGDLCFLATEGFENEPEPEDGAGNCKFRTQCRIWNEKELKYKHVTALLKSGKAPWEE